MKAVRPNNAVFGNMSGGGHVGPRSAPNAGMGKADGGLTGPTPFGQVAGGGQGRVKARIRAKVRANAIRRGLR